MFNLNKKNKIGTNPSLTDEKPEFPERESQLPLPKNKVPMPNKEKVLLEKEVKYKDKYWFVRIREKSIEIYHNDEKNKVIGNQIYASELESINLIDATKRAVEKAYSFAFPIDKYEYFNKWDGNMDNELPEIQP